jgi:dTDP-4-dehydrorhamnose reductase
VRVALIGANGQLGRDIWRSLEDNGDEVVGLTHSDIDIASQDAVSAVLDVVAPEVLINTAAMHHVEKCETDPERAYAVNAMGARNLAIACRDRGALLIHVSTDYVFDGAKGSPYVETDGTCPLNIYGRTKLAGEEFVKGIASRYFIVRTSALYGKSQCRAKGGLNFVELMLKLAKERDELRVVDNEVVSPTSTAELATHIVSLTRFEGYGLYHATADGSCSWYQFAQTILSIAGIKTRVVVAAPGDFPSKVPRPAYSVLENRGLKTNGMDRFKTWQEGLRYYLSDSV